MNKSKCKVCGSAHTIKYGIRNDMQLDPNIQILLPESTTQFDPLRLCMLKIPRNLTHTPKICAKQKPILNRNKFFVHLQQL